MRIFESASSPARFCAEAVEPIRKPPMRPRQQTERLTKSRLECRWKIKAFIEFKRIGGAEVVIVG